MVRPLNDSPFIYGFYDPGGEQLMAERGIFGWILFTEELGCDPNDRSGRDYSQWANKGYGILVRLNHGYEPRGTIPVSGLYADFAQRCGNFVRHSNGCHIWIIGNEMNHPVERPEISADAGTPKAREVILPNMYANCYRRCRSAIKALDGRADDQVILGAIAPWNVDTIYGGNPNGDWVKYLSDLLLILGPRYCDGLSMHAYTHGADPQMLYTDTYMDPPFHQRQFNFRVYQDFMRAVPMNMRSLPVYLTEMDQNTEWKNENSGWLQRAYGEVDWWNQQPGNQKIRAAVVYRWTRGLDIWGIEGKAGVLEDFRQAMVYRYTWPSAPTRTNHAGFIAHNTPGSMSASSSRQVTLTVENQGNTTWPSQGAGAVRLGFRWVDTAGVSVTLPADVNAYTSLVRSVAPGERIQIASQLVAPATPSAYLLIWDLEETGICWFADQGSTDLQVKVVVEPTEPTVEPITFEDTGFTARSAFAAFYYKYGAAVTGSPISAEYVDSSSGLKTQDWQRVVMEEYAKGKIRLANAGQQLRTLRQTVDKLQQQLDGLLKEKGRGLRSAAPSITDISATLPHDPGCLKPRPVSRIRYLAFSHTGVDSSVKVEAIAAAHQAQFGAPLFQYVITANGVIWQTSALDYVVAPEVAWVGQAVHIALAGDFTASVPPAAQIQGAARLSGWLMGRFGLRDEAIRGTGELIGGISPGQQWLTGQRWKDRLLVEIAAVLEPDNLAENDRNDPDRMSKQLEQLRAVFRQAQAQIESLSQERTHLQARVAELSATEADLRRQLAELQAEKRDLATQTSGVRQESGALAQELFGVVQEREEMGRRIAQLEARLAELQPGPAGRTAGGAPGEPLAEGPAGRLITGPAAVSASTTPSGGTAHTDFTATAGTRTGRALRAVPMPRITDITDQLPRHGSLVYESRPLSTITHIAIHQSSGPANVPPQEIAAFQVGRNLPGIAYHYFVAPDGTIYQTNRPETVSSHVYRHNHYALGVCVAGIFNGTIPTPRQISQSGHLVAWLIQRLGIALANVRGHGEFPDAAGSCPGSDWLEGRRWRDLLMARVQAVQQGDGLPAPKTIGHYLLFWHRPNAWAREEWQGAQGYIARFRPTAGFSVDDARTAEYVTIVGGPEGVPWEAEGALLAAGCRVERVAGPDPAATHRLLEEMALSGRRFCSFEL